MLTRYASGQGRHFRNLHEMQQINKYPTIIGCNRKAGIFRFKNYYKRL